MNFRRREGGEDSLLGVVYNTDYVLPIRSLYLAERGVDEPSLVDTLSFIQDQDAARDKIDALLEVSSVDALQEAAMLLDDVQLLPSILRPLSIRDCLGFVDHLTNSIHAMLKDISPILGALNTLSMKLRGKPLFGVPSDINEIPYHYFSNLNNIVGDGAIVTIPEGESQMDYELELGVVIGKQGKNIPKQEAHSYIAGYTIFNDFSARKIQFNFQKGRIGPGKGKSFDGGNALGPYYVTADEIDNVYALGMRAWVNGEQWTASSMDKMSMRFDVMINALSQDETLYPGDIIGSGTTPTGCGLERGRYLKPGDVVELEIDGLGRLTNTMA